MIVFIFTQNCKKLLFQGRRQKGRKRYRKYLQENISWSAIKYLHENKKEDMNETSATIKVYAWKDLKDLLYGRL